MTVVVARQRRTNQRSLFGNPVHEVAPHRAQHGQSTAPSLALSSVRGTSIRRTSSTSAREVYPLNPRRVPRTDASPVTLRSSCSCSASRSRSSGPCAALCTHAADCSCAVATPVAAKTRWRWSENRAICTSRRLPCAHSLATTTAPARRRPRRTGPCRGSIPAAPRCRSARRSPSAARCPGSGGSAPAYP